MKDLLCQVKFVDLVGDYMLEMEGVSQLILDFVLDAGEDILHIHDCVVYRQALSQC